MRSAPDPTAGVVRHYDQLDRIYREIWGEHVHHGLWWSGRESSAEAVEELARTVAARAGIGPGSRVCDVGCGYGATARLLASELGARVTAVTVTPSQYRYAEAATEGGNPRYLLRDWLDSRLPDAAFDAVVAIESLEHMADPGRALREVRRVLRPGGRLAACVWSAASTPPSATRRLLLDPIRREGRLSWLPDEPEIRAALEAAGLRVCTVEDLSGCVRRTWSICLARLARALATRSAYRRFLLDAGQSERVFAITMVRIWLAYRTGAMRYLLVAAQASTV